MQKSRTSRPGATNVPAVGRAKGRRTIQHHIAGGVAGIGAAVVNDSTIAIIANALHMNQLGSQVLQINIQRGICGYGSGPIGCPQCPTIANGEQARINGNRTEKGV